MNIIEQAYVAPNYSIEAEMSVLGSMILDKNAMELAKSKMSGFEFFSPAHKLIFDAMVDLITAGRDVDQVSLEAELGVKRLTEIGGPDYLLELAMYPPSTSNIRSYIEIVAGLAMRRSVAAQARELSKAVCDPDVGLDEIRAKVAHLQNVPTDRPPVVVKLKDVSIEGTERGCPSGFTCIDSLNTTGGFPCGQTTVIRAYQKSGKSAMMVTASVNQGIKGLKVLYATFADLGADQLKRRIMRQVCGWGKRPDTLELSKDFDDQLKYIGSWDYSIYDASALETGNDIETFSQWFTGENEKNPREPFDVVYLDYAQEIRSSDRKAFDDYSEANIVSYKLNRLAKRHPGIAFVIGAQITEGANGAKTKTKGSRTWEERAGLVLTLERTDTAVSLEVTFNRFGPGGDKFQLGWDGPKTRFLDAA